MSRPSGVARFNPRTREGCDDIIPRVLSIVEVSIHAPARGATQFHSMMVL